MLRASLSQALLMAAEAYLSLGYSVIPVWGMADLARPKVAGVEWGIFQRRRPTLAEIKKWFLESDFGGIAIVTGRISGLAVLDFDTREGFHDFSVRYPDLVETSVIQTRRGFHVYYRLPPHLHLSSRKGQGVDLLADGRYVVARPTCIDGYIYKLIQGGQPKNLTAFDVERVTRFLDAPCGIMATFATKPEFTASWEQQEGIQIVDTVKRAIDLRQTYRAGVQNGRGRNEALFQASLQARDAGWTADEVLATLADVHVHQPTNGSHRRETSAQRYAEARRTVASVFSRPPRPKPRLFKPDELQTIPNRVREHLFNRGETRTVRVLDGLRLKRIKSGDAFTTEQALGLLKGVVGRDSVYAALKATNQAGEPLFKRQILSPAPPIPANAATNTQTNQNKCFSGREKKSGITNCHRPAIVYIMPSNDELCRYFGVKLSYSDALTLDDLTSAKKTRMAAHRELIRRRPGQYPRRWLARRLGVSCMTIDTYNREIEGLHSRHCFWEQPIYWSNLKAVPDGIEVDGAVLVDETGKRYPARRAIAAHLLRQGKKVVYKRQEVNYYWYSDEDALPDLSVKSSLPTRPEEPHLRHPGLQPTRDEHPGRSPLSPNPATRPFAAAEKPFDSPTSAAVSIRPAVQLPSGRNDNPQPPINLEPLAQWLYEALQPISTDPKSALSLATARRLAGTYPRHRIEKGLSLLSQRRNIRNPVGFLITYLRCESLLDRLF